MDRMHMIYKDRMTAKMEGDFVVFLIGMRINKPLAVHKYLPVLNAIALGGEAPGIINAQLAASVAGIMMRNG